MKFKIHKANFLEALTSVQGIVNSRSSLPVLSNVLISAQGEKLTFTTTDFDLTLRYSCMAEIVEEGDITLPVKYLTSVVRELSDQVIEVATDSMAPTAVRLTCGSYRSKISGIAAKEFPAIVNADGGVSYVIAQSAFKEMLRKTYYATATDDARPVLTGLLLSFADGKLKCVATDSRRLALFWSEVEFPAENSRDIVIPQRAVQELIRSLDDEGDLKITIKESQALFEFGDRFIASKLLTGAYPNYQQILFDNGDKKIPVNREELLSVLRRIHVSMTPTTNAIRLHFENNTLTITVASLAADDVLDTVTVKYDGEPLEVVFNPEFIMEPLKNLTSDEVIIELNDRTRPGLIKDGSNFLYLIMPLRV